jgi:hypothetical protein
MWQWLCKGAMAMELNEIQLFVIATVASVIVYLLKMARVTEKPAWLTVLLYGVSLGLAFAFTPLALPPFPPISDIAMFVPALIAWIGEALIPISAFVGFATLVYNTLLKAILDKWVKPLIPFRAKKS